MNAPTRIEIGTMTEGGGIAIPEAMRAAAGLAPGRPYRLSVNEAGQIVVAPSKFTPEEAAERGRRIREAILAVAGKYSTGQSTDEFMREIRGDYEP